MRHLRHALAPVAALLASSCTTVTDCDCIAPQAIVFGTVSGAAVNVAIEVRVAQGACQANTAPTSLAASGRTQTDGTYEVGVTLPPLGPNCFVVTAIALDSPANSVTRRLDVVIASASTNPEQRIRADFALGVQ